VAGRNVIFWSVDFVCLIVHCILLKLYFFEILHTCVDSGAEWAVLSLICKAGVVSILFLGR